MYNHKEIEEKWLSYWKNNKMFLFEEESKKPLYVIDTPPPFTNGALHMGQVYWISYIDTIARYKRMAGFNVLYTQGWDMHGFPTELAVEKKYGSNLSRSDFYQKALELSNSNIKIMRELMLKLGSTFDERYEYKTASDEYKKKVQLALIEMYKKGLVYRGIHPVLWCTRCRSAISREEIAEKEKETSLNYIKFDVVDSKNPKSKSKKTASITIATTRPELLHACVALAVNSNDERFKDMIGNEVIVPIFNKKVKIIGDDSIDQKFGSGCEMICTFGDINDVKMYHKHNLDFVDSINEEGKLINADKFSGMSIKDARNAIIDELKKEGRLEKEEKIMHTVKIHDRCETEVELLQHTQWFIKTKENINKLKEIASEINWIPDSNKQRIFDWINTIEWDWNISRSRVFGTPIPFWHCEKCGSVLPAKVEDLPVDPIASDKKYKCPKCGADMVADTDTCDGWIDTCITPLIVAGWPDNKKIFKDGFPVDVRIQGSDIIRTWAFYTIVGSFAVANDKPFEALLTHGMILGTDGREMHKRWGNGVFPEELMEKYSIDAIRLWAALSGSLGKDKVFSYKDMEYASGFLTKLYNSALLINKVSNNFVPLKEPNKDLNLFDMWILNRFNKVVKEVRNAYDNMLLFEALSTLINFYWHEFCDYYIEDVKHRVYAEEDSKKGSKNAAIFVLNYVLKNSIALLAPSIPFISEEVNSMFSSKSIFEEKLPEYVEMPDEPSFVMNGLLFASSFEQDPEVYGEVLNEIIAEARKQKAKAKIALNKPITSININVPEEYYTAVVVSQEDIKGILKASSINITKGKDLSISINI